MELLFSFIYQETSSVQNFKVQPEGLFTTYIYSQHSCSQSKNTARRAVYNIHLQPAMLFTNYNKKHGTERHTTGRSIYFNPVLCRFKSCCSRIAPASSRSSRVFPVRASMMEGVVVFARSPRFYPFLPVSPRFFPSHSRSLPGIPVFSRSLPYRQYGEKRPNTGYV